ncbi:MAG TPA: FAD-dependent oxidoreductase [Flavipsychrobacter sp.]|nr:FAD-dependent oxidoreductase [Flavipsychrobacter sp.]
MDLISEHPYWLMRNGIPHSYPSLQKDVSADIAIIGTGISGTLTAYYLGKAGYKVVQADRRHAAMGSTVASTSLLQYEIDTPMHDLAEKMGEVNAVRCYQLCLEAIYELRRTCAPFSKHVGFKLRPSLQYASHRKDIEPLRREYELRKKHGFKLRWLETEEIRKLFGLEAKAALLSSDAAEADAYFATHHLLQSCLRMGNQVYDNTNVTKIYHKRDGVLLNTDTGYTIKAKKLVIACGYESIHYIPFKVAKLYSTYAIVTEPVDKKLLWHKRSLIWETAMPYMYYRITGDNRILIGGKDDDFYNPDKRDASVKRKAKQLENAFKKKFPNIPIRTDFRWAGTFAGTADGLPYIGTLKETPNTYFALGFGGNGITFSLVAAKIICDIISGKENKDAELFSFNR